MTLQIKEYRPISTRYQVSALSGADIDLFVSESAINPEVTKALNRVLSQEKMIAGIDAAITDRKALISDIAENQQRVRENMKALKGGAEEKSLVERYARELNDQEDRVQSLESDMSDLRQRRDAAQKSLTLMLDGLKLEARL